MTPERYAQIKQILDQAFSLTAEERQALLNQLNADDPDLYREVESLLVRHAATTDYFTNPVPAFATADFAGRLASAPLPYDSIGSFKLVRELGHGGMGTVFLGERADGQFQQRVAIKLLRFSGNAGGVLQRFKHERQILASLDHPNIAKLLDGGTTQDGQPYLVMEFIEGVPIDLYCQRNQLSLNDRLRLFRQVCAAVHYAHQHLVIHRDLKPSNILVTTEGVPKLLDFGIAKLLAPEQFDLTVFETGTHGTPMTPAYASPEQVRGQTISTATDVYSLGIVLYELLTGRRPYEVSGSSALWEMARIICEVEPARPSTAVEHALSTRVAEPAQTTNRAVKPASDQAPEKWRRQLRGDLDNIVLMALRKEAQSRYASVEQLSEDLRRYLEGLPVSARPATFGYRASKFIRRHRTGVLAATAAGLLLITGLCTTLWQAQRARSERARAERRFNDVRRLANSFLFEIHDSMKNLPGATPTRALLVKRALEYLDSLAREASNDSSLQSELASAYEKVGQIQGDPYSANLGDTAGALQSYRKALALREALLQRAPHERTTQSDLARSQAYVADMLMAQHDFKGALELHRRALQLRSAVATAPQADLQQKQDLSRSYESLSNTQLALGDTDGAWQSMQAARQILDQLAAQYPATPTVERGRAILAGKASAILAAKGEAKGALEVTQQALRILQPLADSDALNATHQRDLAFIHNQLGNLFWDGGNLRAALQHYRAGLNIRTALSNNDPHNLQARRDLALSLMNAGYTQVQLGELVEGLANCRRAIEIHEALAASNPTHPDYQRDLLVCYNYFGDLQRSLAEKQSARSQQWAEAKAWYQRSLQIYDALQKQGLARPSDTSYGKQLAQAIAECEAKLQSFSNRPRIAAQ